MTRQSRRRQAGRPARDSSGPIASRPPAETTSSKTQRGGRREDDRNPLGPVLEDIDRVGQADVHGQERQVRGHEQLDPEERARPPAG